MLSNPPESKPKALTRVISPIAFFTLNNNLAINNRRKNLTKQNKNNLAAAAAFFGCMRALLSELDFFAKCSLFVAVK
jgi:hypothetical protein